SDLLDRVRLVLLVATPASAGWWRGLPWPLGLFRLRVPREIDRLNEEWDLLRKERGLRVVSLVGLHDKAAPYDAGRHWDARNVLVANQDHVGLGQDIDLLSRVLYDQLKGPSGATAD